MERIIVVGVGPQTPSLAEVLISEEFLKLAEYEIRALPHDIKPFEIKILEPESRLEKVKTNKRAAVKTKFRNSHLRAK